MITPLEETGTTPPPPQAGQNVAAPHDQGESRTQTLLKLNKGRGGTAACSSLLLGSVTGRAPLMSPRGGRRRGGNAGSQRHAEQTGSFVCGSRTEEPDLQPFWISHQMRVACSGGCVLGPYQRSDTVTHPQSCCWKVNGMFQLNKAPKTFFKNNCLSNRVSEHD